MDTISAAIEKAMPVIEQLLPYFPQIIAVLPAFRRR